MKQTILSRLFVLILLLTSTLAFSSCGSDDEPDNVTYYDFSIEWEVKDKGDYTVAAAQAIAADFTKQCQYVFMECTEAQAKEKFDDFCQRLRYELATDYKELTLVAKLIRVEGEKEMARKTFFINPEGTTIK